MLKKNPRPAAPLMVETLEDRTLLSANVPFVLHGRRHDAHEAVVVAPQAATVATRTNLTASTTSSEFGQDVTFTTRVKVTSGTPKGNVEFIDGTGAVLGTVAVRHDHAALTLDNLYVGVQDIHAVYEGTRGFAPSTSTISPVTVVLGSLTTLTDGLAVGTVTAGSGDGAALGQTLTVDYSGFLSTGKKFQTGSFSFVLGEGQVIAGFDEGMGGASVGETRVLIIPPALAYGRKGSRSGGIPRNATLTFIVHVTAIA